MGVEQVRDEGKVETRVSGDQRGRREVLPTPNVPCICKHLLSPRAEVGSLERGEGALIGFELMEKDSVILPVLDILAEVVDPERSAVQRDTKSIITGSNTSVSILQPSDDS